MKEIINQLSQIIEGMYCGDVEFTYDKLTNAMI